MARPRAYLLITVFALLLVLRSIQVLTLKGDRLHWQESAPKHRR